MNKTILMTINELYVDQLAVALTSLFKHNPDEHVTLVATVGTAHIDELIAMECFKGQVDVKYVTPFDTSWFPNGTFSAKTIEGMCLRLQALDMLMEERPELDRVLYLDSDIVVTKPIGGVWGGPIDNHFVAAALDYPSLPSLFQVYKNHSDWGRRMGINRNYFNSGVMLLNMKKIRARYRGIISEGFKDMYDGTWLLPDQDYLNIILTEGCPSVILPKCFNWMYEMQVPADLSASMLLNGRMEGLQVAHLWHYAGTYKPWALYHNLLLPSERFIQIRFDIYHKACEEAAEMTDGCFPRPLFRQIVQNNHETFKFIGLMVGDLV